MATSESKMDTTTTGTAPVKKGLAQCLKGGVIMDVMNVEQARIAEQVRQRVAAPANTHRYQSLTNKIANVDESLPCP